MKLYFSTLIITLLIAVIALSGCGGGGGGSKSTNLSPSTSPLIQTLQEAQQPGTWTILVYLDADNDLESAGIANFNQMERIGSTRDVRVVVQMDRRSGYDASNGNWTDTRRYLITHDSDKSAINSIRVDNPEMGEVNMADWHSLKNFVDWGMQEFPADHYCLIVWDHGSGWQIRTNMTLPQYRYVVTDDTSGRSMNVTDIAQALNGYNIDVIGFDACYMQQLEVAYELRNCARYMVASTAAEPAPGYNYSTWLSRIGSDTTPEELCRDIVEDFMHTYPSSKGITQSAVDLSKIEDVAQAASSLAQILQSKANSHSILLRNAREQALNYSTITDSYDRYSLDLIDYANRCANAVGPAANAAYVTLNNAISDAVIAEAHNSDTPSSRGLAVYVPSPDSYDTRYSQLDLAANTQWDEWLSLQVQ